jgi:hypothetical protein
MRLLKGAESASLPLSQVPQHSKCKFFFTVGLNFLSHEPGYSERANPRGQGSPLMDLTRAHSERHAKGATGKTATKGEDSDSRSNNVRAVVFMGLLALQIGVQPVLVSECIDKEQVWAVVHLSPTRTLLRASCAPCMNGFSPRLVSPQVVDGKRPVDII